MIRCLLIGVLLWLPSLLTAQSMAIVPAAVPSAYVGEVNCEAGQPVPVPHDPAAAEQHGISRAENLRHEAAHVAQLLNGCDALLTMWARDTVARMDAEVQATCIGLEVYPDALTRTRRRGEARQVLAMLYGSAVAFADLYAAFERWCK